MVKGGLLKDDADCSKVGVCVEIIGALKVNVLFEHIQKMSEGTTVIAETELHCLRDKSLLALETSSSRLQLRMRQQFCKAAKRHHISDKQWWPLRCRSTMGHVNAIA